MNRLGRRSGKSPQQIRGDRVDTADLDDEMDRLILLLQPRVEFPKERVIHNRPIGKQIAAVARAGSQSQTVGSAPAMWRYGLVARSSLAVASHLAPPSNSAPVVASGEMIHSLSTAANSPLSPLRSSSSLAAGTLPCPRSRSTQLHELNRCSIIGKSFKGRGNGGNAFRSCSDRRSG